ncbi:hypothetical protein PV04_02501 [Phialophora macrospora]|uniref:Uncharacterized protein n=1 Tax=Phialophora macrospora TaxID=1851006 RepID=A0A0D2FUK0_9EURO|nr:hypothetical protein PV04_02501 [Phialophora macrospora]
MAPASKVIVGPVSIPVQYTIPDTQCFTQKWWAEATKTNLFWTQFKRYTSRGTVNKRIGLEITKLQDILGQMPLLLQQRLKGSARTTDGYSNQRSGLVGLYG